MQLMQRCQKQFRQFHDLNSCSNCWQCWHLFGALLVCTAAGSALALARALQQCFFCGSCRHQQQFIASSQLHVSSLGICTAATCCEWRAASIAAACKHTEHVLCIRSCRYCSDAGRCAKQCCVSTALQGIAATTTVRAFLARSTSGSAGLNIGLPLSCRCIPREAGPILHFMGRAVKAPAAEAPTAL